MRLLFIRDQMTQKLTTKGIDHHTAFVDEQSPYHIVSYKWSGNDKGKTIQNRKLTDYNLCTKK